MIPIYYAVYTNTDLTEGRGHQYVIALCKLRATAQRIGHKGYVMGTDCPIEEIAAVEDNGCFYIPLRAVPIKEPTTQDIELQREIDRTNEARARIEAALQRARALGLSDADIATLSQGASK